MSRSVTDGRGVVPIREAKVKYGEVEWGKGIVEWRAAR